MQNHKPCAYVVDDDPSVCRSVKRLLQTADIDVEVFTSAQDFLVHESYVRPSCLILDVQMPSMNGIDLQDKLASKKINMPIIFVSGHATIPMSVRAIKQGAINFLEKPYDSDVLMAEIEKCIELDVRITENDNELSSIKARLDTLTSREKEVYDHIITGQLNKQVAAELGVCEKTIKVHRASILKKMQVRNLAELIHLNDKKYMIPVISS